MDQVPVEWRDLTEGELERIVQVDAFTNRYRLAFWQEYERAQTQVERMDLSRISMTMGVPSAYLRKQLQNPQKLAWIICPPASYSTFLEETLSFGLKRLRNDILTLPIFDSDGRVDTAAAKLILQAVAFVDMRRHGGIVQKNIHVVQDAKAVKAELSLREIEDRIRELETTKTISIAHEAVGPQEVELVDCPQNKKLSD